MPEWERVSLGEVIRLRKEFITIDDLTTYKRCRVQVRAQGIVLRDEVAGSAIKTKKQQVCRACEFLVAEIDAKMGGFGIVPPELEGAVVSSHYFLFEIDEAKLDRDFLDLYSKTPEFMEQVSAQGSTNYAAIRPSHVLGYTMPLPPLPEQQRIVARVKGLLDKVEEARRLREEVSQKTETLYYSNLRMLREKVVTDGHQLRTLGEVTKITSGGTPPRDNASFWNGSIPWVKTGELVDDDVISTSESITDSAVGVSGARLLPENTVLIALYGQGQTRGRTGILRMEASCNQACCAILPVHTLRPEFIQWWLRSMYLELREDAKGGAQPNWNSGLIKSIEIALPTTNQQSEIIEKFSKLTMLTQHAQKVQKVADQELQALPSSILAQAFAGAL